MTKRDERIESILNWLVDNPTGTEQGLKMAYRFGIEDMIDAIADGVRKMTGPLLGEEE